MFNVFVIAIIFVILLSTFIANDFVKKKNALSSVYFYWHKNAQKIHSNAKKSPK